MCWKKVFCLGGGRGGRCPSHFLCGWPLDGGSGTQVLAMLLPCCPQVGVGYDRPQERGQHRGCICFLAPLLWATSMLWEGERERKGTHLAPRRSEIHVFPLEIKVPTRPGLERVIVHGQCPGSGPGAYGGRGAVVAAKWLREGGNIWLLKPLSAGPQSGNKGARSQPWCL